ncbi:ankyrin repeat domain-containing protein 29-like [Euwallacea similis]|uniref:ankyrin repeat domain-containing protein 29-like n=1 Tax=Euwallacea similis TaxID=1736056 RepID=UPI00344D9C89
MATFYEKLRVRSDVYMDGLLELEEKIEMDVANLLLNGKTQLMVLKSAIPYQVVGNIRTCAKMLSRKLKLDYEQDIACLTWTQCREVVGTSNVIPKLPKLMILEYDKPQFSSDDLTLLQILLDLESAYSSTSHKVIVVVPPETEDLNDVLGAFLADICTKLEFAESKMDKEKKASSLIEAASWGSYSEVVNFIESGVDMEMKDENGHAALHKAAKNGHKKVVETLLLHNANIEVSDDRNMTPMHHASDSGFNDVVILLIEYGANLEAVDSTGWSPLMFASSNGHAEVADTLVVHGAKMNAITSGDWTALHIAADRGALDVVKVLIGYGANHKLLLSNGKTAAQLALEKEFNEIANYLNNLTSH